MSSRLRIVENADLTRLKQILSLSCISISPTRFTRSYNIHVQSPIYLGSVHNEINPGLIEHILNLCGNNVPANAKLIVDGTITIKTESAPRLLAIEICRLIREVGITKNVENFTRGNNIFIAPKNCIAIKEILDRNLRPPTRYVA